MHHKQQRIGSAARGVVHIALGQVGGLFRVNLPGIVKLFDESPFFLIGEDLRSILLAVGVHEGLILHDSGEGLTFTKACGIKVPGGHHLHQA